MCSNIPSKTIRTYAHERTFKHLFRSIIVFHKEGALVFLLRSTCRIPVVPWRVFVHELHDVVCTCFHAFWLYLVSNARSWSWSDVILSHIAWYSARGRMNKLPCLDASPLPKHLFFSSLRCRYCIHVYCFTFTFTVKSFVEMSAKLKWPAQRAVGPQCSSVV